MTTIEKTLQKLQEEHSELCAQAAQLGITVPEDLTVDFDTVLVGKAVCASLANLIGVAEAPEEEHSAASPPKTKKPKKAKAKEKEADAPATAATQESTMSKPTAKKKVAKKATAKKKTAAAKNGHATKRGDSKTAKVVALLKHAGGATRAQILKATGWKAVSVQQLAKSAGLKLKVDESERPFKYKVA